MAKSKICFHDFTRIYIIVSVIVLQLMSVRTLPVTTACSYEQNSAYVTRYQALFERLNHYQQEIDGVKKLIWGLLGC